MASRPIVQQPARGEAVVGVNMHQKKNAAGADGRNRRALGDIGNLVTIQGIDAVKPQAQISRPMTRKFCAQLLANAQAAAAAENNKSRPHNYMVSQPEVNEKMRAILIDWLIDVHQKFELSPETLYLTINIIDRFLSVKAVPRRELQLVGISATLMASKYEEIWPPEVNDLVMISDRAYTHEQVLVMEKTILAKLEWTLTVPTHYVFLARFIKASIPDKEMENMVYFLAELGIMHYDTIMFCPSMVAASAVYAARCTLNKSPVWTETLKLHTGFSESQLKDCAGLLVYLHSTAAENKLKTVHRKYSNPQRGAVAMLPPAKSLLPASLCR
uniref:B-like cyclin n=1 Tax=Manihot esculenta TaxID=3983 RepID=A0A2C9VFE9_MANES